MWPQEVIVGNPEGQIIVGTVDVIKTVCRPVGSLVCAVEPFNHLFVWTEFSGYFIVVGKSNHLGDVKLQLTFGFDKKLLCSKGIGAVTIRNELKVLRQLCKALESHPHSEDTGADATVVRYLITDDGTAGSVHNEPDVGFDAADFDVGFIGDKCFPFVIGILINKRLDADSGSFAVVGDLLMGDLDVIEIFEGLAGFAK